MTTIIAGTMVIASTKRNVMPITAYKPSARTAWMEFKSSAENPINVESPEMNTGRPACRSARCTGCSEPVGVSSSR